MEIEKNELISAEIIDLKGGEILLIPNGVKTIGEAALTPLKNRVKMVLIPGTVTTIKRRAFAGTGVTVVELPESVETIEDDAFEGCENLYEIVLKGDKRDYKTLNPKAVRKTPSLERVALKGIWGVCSQGKIIPVISHPRGAFRTVWSEEVMGHFWYTKRAVPRSQKRGVRRW